MHDADKFLSCVRGSGSLEMCRDHLGPYGATTKHVVDFVTLKSFVEVTALPGRILLLWGCEVVHCLAGRE